jgi:hypothetical protein
MDTSGTNSIEDYRGNDTTRDSGNESAVNIDERRDAKPARDNPKVAGFDLHDPGESYNDAGTDTGDYQPRRRGRKPGSKNKPKIGEEKASSNIAENLERLLLSVHTMGSAFFSCPELELDPEEAKSLARAIREVAKHYPITLDPKRLALIELGTVCAMIYGTRAVVIYRRITNESNKPHAVPTPIKRATSSTQPVNSATTPQPQTTTNPKPNGAIHRQSGEPWSPNDLGTGYGVNDEPEY